jgi:DNA-binding FadR family transcriptional regulator
MECAARLGKDAGLLDPNRLNGLLTTWRRDRDVQSDRLTELFEMRAVPEGLCARNAAATFDETEAAMRRHIESTQGNFTMLPPVG